MRTIWNGSISFGLVNIPIGLALATQRKDVSFRTLHRECGTPIKQKRWCPVHERDVEPDELVKGWEVAKGEYVLVEEADLEAVALTSARSRSRSCASSSSRTSTPSTSTAPTTSRPPTPTRSDSRTSCCCARCRRRAWRRSASSCSGARRTSASSARRAARSLLETLFFAEDVRAKNEIEEAVAETDVQKAELQLAEQVISSLAGEWTPEDFENEYRSDLSAMLEAKLAGQEIVAPEPVAETPVIDLMEALRRASPTRRAAAPRELQGRESPLEGGHPISEGAGEEVRLTPAVYAAGCCWESACSCAWKRYLSIFPW